MSIVERQDITSIPSLMVWSDLWPAGYVAAGKGWNEQLSPGISVLLDETGDEAAHWLSVFAGHTVPGRGRVQCAGLCSQVDSAAYQSHVYWHKPRAHLLEQESTARQWLEGVAQRWSTWSDAAWELHCEGFELSPHMDKPMWHLSTGCLRKLGIAAALASGARLTLIEEPIGALDSTGIRYLCKALDVLGKELADQPKPPRWILVSHWEPLPSVTWDEVLAPPALHALADAGSANALVQKVPIQHE